MCSLLTALFERSGPMFQRGQCFTGKVGGTGDQDWSRSLSRNRQCCLNRCGNGISRLEIDLGKNLRERLRRKSALASNLRQDKECGDRQKNLDNCLCIFIRKNRQDNRGALIMKNFAPRFDEDRCRGGVMGAINDGALIPLLKTRRPLH